MVMKAAVALTVVLLAAACTDPGATSKTRAQASNSATTGQESVVIVRGFIGIGGGTRPEALVSMLGGAFNACREWLIDGLSAGPAMDWEVHLLTNDAEGVRQRALSVTGVRTVSITSASGLAVRPVTGVHVNAVKCA